MHQTLTLIDWPQIKVDNQCRDALMRLSTIQLHLWQYFTSKNLDKIKKQCKN